MSFNLSLLVLFIGTILLYFGANFLVKGSANIARILGVKPLIVGLTIVAFGTSMPEFMVSMFGVLKGASDISVGNIIGSNVANIGLILGVSGLIAPIALKYHHIRQQLLILLLGSLFFSLMSYNGISQLEGWLFIGVIIAYVIYLVRSSREDEIQAEMPESDDSMLRNILYTIGGIAGLIFASRAIIEGATVIAKHFGLSEMVIGMTIVAVGTSLPELAASIMAAAKQEADISIGNVIGSNLFNMFFVGGGAATVHGLAINTSIYTFEVPFMLLYSLLLFPIIFISKGIKRIHALGFLLIYILFILISLIWR
jgi:cation:H+ antiporter